MLFVPPDARVPRLAVHGSCHGSPTPGVRRGWGAIVRHAQQMAREVEARAIVVHADVMTGDDDLGRLVQAVNFPTILVTRSRVEAPPPGLRSGGRDDDESPCRSTRRRTLQVFW